MLILLFIFLMTGPTVHGAENDFPVRAPAAVKGTTEAMLSPDFWTARIENPDRVVMTVSQIEALNAKNADREVPPDHPYAKNIRRIERDGPLFRRMKPLDSGGAFPGETVRERLRANNERLLKGTFYDYWELPLTDKKKAEIIDACALDSVPETIRPKTAMIVRHTSARLYPTPEPAYRMRGYLDDNNVTSLDIGMSAAVLHASKTGDYLFVMTPIAWGWVPAADLAFGSRDQIRKYREASDFVVAVDHKVPFYADAGFTMYGGSLYLGERAALAGKTAGGFTISVPVREFDGSLSFRGGWIRRDALVSEGWLPYTQRNVITTAFRILERPYGWHDSWGERDCGGIMRVIFNCFGFTLPRYWSFEQLCSDRATFVGDMDDVAEKNRLLATMPAGITFTGTTGHIVLYLGSVDGTPYSIHQCGWNYKDGEVEYKMARVVVSDYINIGFTMDRVQYFTPMAP